MTSESGTLRYSVRQTPELLLWALAFSVAFHLIVFGGYELGRRFNWWDRDFLPAWLRRITEALTLVHPPAARPPPPPPQPQLTLAFVEVAPDAESVPAPDKPTHYSSRNSRAANPDPQADSNIPKLTGTQTHVPKAETVPRTKAFPLAPSEPKPAPPPAPEQLAMAKPEPGPGPALEKADAAVQPQQPPHERPRTLAEARLQQAMPGEMMRQDGGVRRGRIVPSFDAVGTPFGEYDAEIIRAIQERWYDLLDAQALSRPQSGKVVVQFRLNYDGRVSDMTVIEHTVDDILTYLCQRAISDPAPYARWPTQMRQLIGADYREVTFTFFYD